MKIIKASCTNGHFDKIKTVATGNTEESILFVNFYADRGIVDPTNKDWSFDLLPDLL